MLLRVPVPCDHLHRKTNCARRTLRPLDLNTATKTAMWAYMIFIGGMAAKKIARIGLRCNYTDLANELMKFEDIKVPKGLGCLWHVRQVGDNLYQHKGSKPRVWAAWRHGKYRSTKSGVAGFWDSQASCT